MFKINKVKCSMCHVLFKQVADSRYSRKEWTVISPISYIRLLKNEQKLNLFSAHFEQHVNATTSCTDLRKYMTFKVVKQLNPTRAMKPFMKPNCNLSPYLISRERL